MDPLTTSDGRPWGPIRYEQIAKECYIISKNIHTSYNEILQISPKERTLMIQFLQEEAKRNEEELLRMKAEREANKQKERR